MICFTLPGYAHLYRSLLRFAGISSQEAKQLLYTLNTANIDTYMYRLPGNRVTESKPGFFCSYLNKHKRPYRTEVQLYKALYCLEQNIDARYITSEQRMALAQLRCIMENLNYRFCKVYGIQIDCKETVYAECAYSLIPDDDEPSVCLYRDQKDMHIA